MLIHIKKSLKYLIIFVGIILMFPTLLYLVIQIPEVQTLIVKRITNHFSAEIKSTISVGRMDYRFFNKLSISDILIKDNHNDTLIYSPSVSIGLKGFSFKHRTVQLGRIMVIKPVVAIITDSTGLMNLNWYLDLLKSSNDTTRKASTKISIDEIDLNDAKLSVINHTGLPGKSKMDFNNLKLTGLNGIIEDFKIQNDTTSFDVYNLGFKEKSGFKLNKMSSFVKLAKRSILLNRTFIRCDSSIIEITKAGLIADSDSSFKRFTEEVKLDIQLDKSLINTSDLKYFLNMPDSLNESIWLSGKFMGTISELRGRDINLSYRSYTSVDCDFDLSGLPKIENTYIFIGVNSLKTNAKDLEKIYQPGKGYVVVPEVLYKLGNISFDGSFTGFTTDFVTYGKFRTSQGNFRTDISLRPEKSKRYRVKGLINASEINLGELSDNTELFGKLSIQANVDGYAYNFKKFEGNITGKIDSVEINKYEYRNIDLNGYFTDKTWDGSINIADPNIKLDLLGMFNFNGKLPEFNFTLNLTGANLYKLNIDKIDSTAYLSMLLTSNFKGNNIDNLDGEIKLLHANIKKFNKSLELYDFSVKTYSENGKPSLSLRTDFVDGDIKGYYNFAALNDLIKSSLGTLVPANFSKAGKRNNLVKNNFTFEINFKNTDKLNDFFKTGVQLADKSFIKGSVLSDSIISINGNTASLSLKGIVFKDLTMNTKVSGSELSFNMNSSNLLYLGNSDIKSLSADLKTKPDNFIFTVGWDNKDSSLYKGTITARGSIEKNPAGKHNSILKVDIDSTHLYSDNNLWRISRSSILVDSTSIKVNKLYVSNIDRYYQIDGAVSANPADTLFLQFRGIDISPLNYVIMRNNPDPNKISLDIKGQVNGSVELTNVYKNLLLTSNLVVNRFSILGADYGDISIVSALDNVRKVVNINASNNLAGVQMFDVNGQYDPRLKKIDLTAKADRLRIEALNPLLKVFASGITGFASGKVRLTGESGNIFLTGAVKAEDAKMKIDYLQTVYKINDSVRFDKSGIKFNNVKVTDEDGKTAILSGAINHRNFKEYNADLTITITKNDFLVLNTLPRDNPMFYGKVYASGVTRIRSGPNSLAFDISATTGKNTKFFIPLNTGLSVSEYSFVSFVKPVNGVLTDTSDSTNVQSTAPKVAMDLNIELTVTPEAVAQIIFDAKVGDKMTGSGSGILNITLNKKGEFRITGDYNIVKGDYLFTLKNILNKKFDVENGGKIMFNGKLEDAEIDLKAMYQKFNTSLYPVLPFEQYKDVRVSVEPQLLLTGKLFNPNVGFQIYLPSSDEETRASLNGAISTEEELQRQFFYLLVMKSFYSDQGANSVSSAPSGTSAVAVTTTEMLSNQLSNWISSIAKDFDLGFTYTPGTGNSTLNTQEVQVALSTQVLNDKVTLNGNFDYRGVNQTTGNTDQIIGDFDAELKLTEKISFKVFNRFNDTYSGRGPYTQGVGIFFKKDFEKFSDLFRKKPKPDMKKEDEPKIKEK
jgi:hypothetical protein